MRILDILFGKQAKIFNDNGRVVHKLPDEKWNRWKKRYTSSNALNWKNHTGTRAGAKKQKNSF